MNAEPFSFNRTLSPEIGHRVDKVCNQFENAWKKGQRPRIEDYVTGSAGEERVALLRELIALDVDYRRSQGEEARAEDYLPRFPTLDRQSLDKVLTGSASGGTKTRSTVKPAATRADAKPHSADSPRIRCPHCQNAIQLSDDRSDEVLCPGCGQGFRVCDTRTTTSLEPMKPLGKYQLLERVGVGGFGAVWRARDTELDRIVALKIAHTGLLSSPTELERWRREARAAAQVRHPGIVAVHDAITLDGLPVIVSDFIVGVPLRDLLEVRRLSFREAAALVVRIAEALEYAHDKGLVHRDIKPANIMVESDHDADVAAARQKANGSVPSENLRPLLMDFGLALRAEAEVTMTIEGQIVGTFAYMSPEQAAGRGHAADRRSDVYSLGVVLYELLTGELPFRGSKAMIVFQVLREEPRPLRRLNDKVPRDLETICLKALAKEPDRRFATAQDFADDLKRYLKGEPIRARPVRAPERLWRWCRRNRLVASLLAALTMVLLVGTASLIAYWLDLQMQEAHKRDHLAKLHIECGRLFETSVKLVERKQWSEAKVQLSKVLTLIESEPQHDADAEMVSLKGRADGLLSQTTEEESLYGQRQKIIKEVAAFRDLVGETQFHVAGTDPKTERMPFFNPGKANTVGSAALALADGWGVDLAAITSAEERNALKNELHDLILVLVQSKTQRSNAAEPKKLLDLLERAKALSGESQSYHRLRSQCFAILGDAQEAQNETKMAETTSATTFLDDYLLGEKCRIQALGQGAELAQLDIEKKRILLEQAVAHYDRVLEKMRSHYWALYQKGRCYLQLGRSGEAAATFAACEALQPASAWGYSASGLAMIAIRSFDAAERHLKNPLALEFPMAKLNLALAHYLQSKDHKRALQEFTTLLQAPPKLRLPEAFYYRGQVYLELKDYRKALEDFASLIKEDKDFAPAYLVQAQAYFGLADSASGLKALSRFLSLVQPKGIEPESLEEFELRGRLLRRWIPRWELSGKVADSAWDAAKAELIKALNGGRQSAEIFDDLGWALQMTGEFDLAKQAYNSSLKSNPANVEALIHRGWVFAQGLKPPVLDLAKRDFTEALRLSPRNSEAYTGLGYVLALQKNQVVEAFRKAHQALLYGGGADYFVLHNVACIHAALSETDLANEFDHQTFAITVLKQAVELWEKGGKLGGNYILDIQEERAFGKRLKARPEFLELTGVRLPMQAATTVGLLGSPTCLGSFFVVFAHAERSSQLVQK